MIFYQVIGIAIITFLIIYLVLYMGYKITKPEADPAVEKEDMPRLLPLPIPTAKHKEWLPKILTWVFNIRKWELIENWRYKLKDDVEIIIPKDFEFDGASIPRPLWAFLSPVGLLMIPGLIHDYAYRYAQLWQIDKNGEIIPFKKNAEKDYWDELFLKVSFKVNGLVLINILAWIALNLGGTCTWQERRENHKEPEKPVIENA